MRCSDAERSFTGSVLLFVITTQRTRNNQVINENTNPQCHSFISLNRFVTHTLLIFSTPTSFIIFSLLLPYVHREGSVGHQARDALLLCMSLSQKNSNVGSYIARHTSMCTVLVTGLGGLYSLLPNTIDISTADWHRITPDDVADIGELTVFMNALEFCNAVVQVAHELIREQLLDVMYLGFIIPVLGPALLQVYYLQVMSALDGLHNPFGVGVCFVERVFFFIDWW